VDESSAKSGCGFFGILFIALICCLLVVAALRSAKRTTDSPGNDTAQVFSGNHVMSDNQLNLFSDVNNFDCVGANACTINVGDQTTVTTNTTTSQTRIDGDRNTVYISPIDGARFCVDPSQQMQTDGTCK